MATTAVVIPTFNCRAILLRGLARLFETLPPSHRVIVVDSGSSDGTAEALRQVFPQVLLIEGDPSLWWAAATNLGVEKARALGCQYVLTYNDDNLAMPNLFAALAQAAKNAPQSIVAAVCCYADKPNTIFFAGRMRAMGSDRFYYLNMDQPLSVLEQGLRRADLLHGMCTLFPISVFDQVGLFNQKDFPQVHADDDLLLRASRAGFSLHVALAAVVLNDRSKTGINPYDRRLGLKGIFQLLFSRKSSFQLEARSRFLWYHRRSLISFGKTWLCDYARLFAVLAARWFLPLRAFDWVGVRWRQRMQDK